MLFLTGTLLGLILGAAAGAAAFWWFTRQNAQQLHNAFKALSAEQLTANTQSFLTLAQEKLGSQTQSHTQELDGKKALIDQNLTTIKLELGTKLEKVTLLMQQLEKDRESKYATLAQQVRQTGEQLSKLNTTTADLTAALSNSRTRGQWGERMAEDVLSLAGLKQNLNYRKQAILTAADGSRPRPDYTFLLPDNRVLHMDVKFPLDDYSRWREAKDDAARAESARRFVAATRNHIRTTSARDYRQAATDANETTLDYLLIFIPNDQIYGFLLEAAPETLTEALSQKVILCSPSTLLAVLAVVHQAMQSFSLNQNAKQVYALLTGIRDQWDKFTEGMDKIGDKLHEAQKAFDVLTTTRTNMLDRQFSKLESIAAPTEADASASPVSLLQSTQPGDTTH